MEKAAVRKALVVDDERDAREFVKAILEPMGWDVAEAWDGASGLKEAKAVKPELIILDVQMPNSNGFEVFSDLARDPETSGAKVIMLTGVAEKTGLHFSAKEMGEFLGKEPDGYAEKPIDPESFKRVVKKVMGGK